MSSPSGAQSSSLHDPEKNSGSAKKLHPQFIKTIDTLHDMSSASPLTPSTPRDENGEKVAFSVLRGSYANSPVKSASVSRNGSGVFSLNSHVSAMSPRASYLHLKLGKFLDDNTEIRETYGIEELRDGFFDAIYVKPTKIQEQVQVDAREEAHAREKSKKNYLTAFFSKFRNIDSVLKVSKAFVAFFVAYVLCLIKPTARWLGPYCYFMPFATLFHHPARSMGSQLEITVLSLAGEAFGMAWSSLALYISTATKASRHGYAGFHATSFLISIFGACWIQAVFVRFHHFALSFVFTILFMESVQISAHVVWYHAWTYGMSYMFGVLLCLVVNFLLFPDFGHLALTNSFSSCLRDVAAVANQVACNDPLVRFKNKRKLSAVSLKLSESVREFCNEISATIMSNEEILSLRNYIQSCISRLRAVPTSSTLFSHSSEPHHGSCYIRRHFAEPTRDCAKAILDGINAAADAFDAMKKMKRSNQISHSDQLRTARENLTKILDSLSADVNSIESRRYLQTYLTEMEVLDMLLFIYHISETGRVLLMTLTNIEILMNKKRRRWAICWPVYPFARAIRRTSAQITHDKGGQTALYLLQTEKNVADVFRVIEEHALAKSSELPDNGGNNAYVRFLYGLWKVSHKLQDFAARSAFKASVCITLMALPAWTEYAKTWYNKHSAWMSLYAAFIGFHPRVPGNLTDVFVRSAAAILGAVWAGIGLRAHMFNPYVLGVFCTIFMLPSLHRYISSTHPRSGRLACVSFAFISLSINSSQNIFTETWTRFVAIEIGIVTSIVVNWIFWPFSARSQVRKSVSVLLGHLSSSYLTVADRYLYRDIQEPLTQTTLQLGEIREARLLQSIDAVQDLLRSTHHEVPLRDTFNASVYVKVLETCFDLFERLSQARINSLHFHVFAQDSETYLSSLRRDAAASVIFVLDMLAGAYRTKRPVLNTLPSAVLARKMLFDRIQEKQTNMLRDLRGRRVQITINDDSDENDSEDETVPAHFHGKDSKEHGMDSTSMHVISSTDMWKMVHEAEFSRAFTEITEDLEKLIGYSKIILGEEGAEKLSLSR